MNKFYKIFVTCGYIITIISTTVLFAGADQRRGLVSAIESLFCGDSYQQQERLIDFLAQLHATDANAFHQLFNYVIYKKGYLDFKLTLVLTEKKLIDQIGTPSKPLKKIFFLLKSIINDYNKEVVGKCCPGCFIFLCSKGNGIKMLKFTIDNSVVLINTITSKKITKKTVPSPFLTPIDQSREIEIHAFDIEDVLKQLSVDITD